MFVVPILGAMSTGCGRWILVAALLGGCHPAPGDSADADTQSVICPAYSGIVGLGTRWEYAYGDGQVTGTFTPEVVTHKADSGAVTVQGRDEGADEDQGWQISRRYVYQCDEQGLWIRSWSLDGVISDEEGENEDRLLFTHDTPALLLPADLAEGDSWSEVFEGDYTYEDGSTSHSAVRYDFEVGPEASLVVPAGEYVALPVTVSTAGSAPYVAWHHQDLGKIQEGSLSLVSYTP